MGLSNLLPGNRTILGVLPLSFVNIGVLLYIPKFSGIMTIHGIIMNKPEPVRNQVFATQRKREVVNQNPGTLLTPKYIGV